MVDCAVKEAFRKRSHLSSSLNSQRDQMDQELEEGHSCGQRNSISEDLKLEIKQYLQGTENELVTRTFRGVGECFRLCQR